MSDTLNKFAEGIKKFNEREFLECHDLLEEVWFESRGTERRFYQGLIHLAVGFFHLDIRGNTRGAVNQLKKGVDKLSKYTRAFQGVELIDLLRNIQNCIDEITEIEKGRISKFDPSHFPLIRFNKELFIPEE